MNKLGLYKTLNKSPPCIENQVKLGMFESRLETDNYKVFYRN